MNNRHDDKIRHNIEREIFNISKEILSLEKRRDELVELMDQPVRKLISLTENENNCFVHDHHMCDYCFDIFDWGKNEIHYYDQDRLDVCPRCVKEYLSEKAL
jgi:hypothetical protein